MELVQPELLWTPLEVPLAPLLFSLSSGDDFVMPDSSSPLPWDFKSYHDLLRCMASALGIQAKFVQENTHKLLDILQSSDPGRINEVILELAKTFWNIPVPLIPTAKHTNKRYYVPLHGFKCFHLYLASNSLAVMVANERLISKRLDLLGRKIYSTLFLQMHVNNKQALLSNYDFVNWKSMAKFTGKLPESSRKEF